MMEDCLLKFVAHAINKNLIKPRQQTFSSAKVSATGAYEMLGPPPSLGFDPPCSWLAPCPS
jgi:hypothetical protein